MNGLKANETNCSKEESLHKLFSIDDVLVQMVMSFLQTLAKVRQK
jgi:hypothetical protein